MTATTWTCPICGQYNNEELSNCRFCNAERLRTVGNKLPPEQAVVLSTLPPRQKPLPFKDPLPLPKSTSNLVLVGRLIAGGMVILAFVCWALTLVNGSRNRETTRTSNESESQVHSTLPPRATRVPGTFTPYPTKTATALPVTATPSSEPVPEIHVVQEGDTLSDIATLYGITIEALITANSLDNPDQIAIGTELIISDERGVVTPNVLPSEVPVAMSSLESVQNTLRDITRDVDATAEIDSDGYLLLTYRIPEGIESFYMGTFRSDLRIFMPKLAMISPELQYTDVEFMAKGTVKGNSESMIAFVAYDKATVESQAWSELTNPQIIALAKRYNYNRHLSE